VFVPGKPFRQARLEPTQVKHLADAPSLALLASIRQGWKGLPGLNAQAYYENSLITDRRKFTKLVTGHNVISHLSSVRDKLERLPLANNLSGQI
jgi:hypothetical protein